MTLKTITVPGSRAIETLHQRRSQFASSGEYAFLIGSDNDLDEMTEAMESAREGQESIIAAATELDLDDWLRERKRVIEDQFYDEDLAGEWPEETEEKSSIGMHKDVLSGKIHPEVILGLADIAQPWHLPAVLNYGGWNECPLPEVQCAFFKRWQERFGAEIAAVSTDIIECVVARPPTDQEGAMKLAWEHYWYCTDVVLQGTQSISNLAAILQNSNYWYFWWD